MNFFRAGFASSALLATCIIATSTASGQTGSKPLFTDYEPLLCVGGGFVAMAGITHNAPLIVIPIDAWGIGAPQSFPTGADDVLGMMCSEEQIELLVIDNKARRMVMPLYTVRWHSDRPRTIQVEQPEAYDLPKVSSAAPTPHNFKEDSLKWQRYAWTGRRGDWYVGVGDVDVPGKDYELHFVSTETGGVSKFVVTLLEKTQDRTKTRITKSIPLVHIERDEVGD